MRERPILLRGVETAPGEAAGISHRDFLAIWKMGGCSWLKVAVSAGLQSAAAGVMAATFFIIRNLVQNEAGLGGRSYALAILGAGGLLAARELLLFASEAIGTRHSLAVFEALRAAIFGHLLRLPLPDLQRRPVGEWVSRCEQDVRMVQGGLLSLSRTAIASPLVIGTYLGAVVWMSPILAGVIALLAAVGLLPVFLLRNRMMAISHRMLGRYGRMTGRLSETFLYLKTVKALCLEGRKEQELREWATDHLHLTWRSSLLSMVARQAATLVMTVCLMAVAFGGRAMVSAGTVTPGELVAVLVGVIMLAQEIRGLNGVLAGFQGFSAAARRYLDTLAMPQERSGPANPPELPRPVPDLTFENVSFSYDEGRCLLKGLNFTVRRGEIFAVAGLSGAGKSTLVDMVLAFRQPQEGRILAAGRPIEAYDLRAWRLRMGALFQSPALFNGTLRHNLLIGGATATDAELWDGIRKLDLEPAIQARREGLDAEVLEAGANWSEGEAQRLVLLRTLLSRPELLLLDEPTSALDARSEETVVRLLRERAAERLTLVITHRMGLAIQADQILVIGAGGIEGLGPPEQMWERCPLFRYMCLAQSVVPSAVAAGLARGPDRVAPP
jgi:ABC-type multidrug transport system fused ATPase/permease subunit